MGRPKGSRNRPKPQMFPINSQKASIGISETPPGSDNEDMDNPANLPSLDADGTAHRPDKAPRPRQPVGARGAKLSAEIMEGLSGFYVMTGMLVYARNQYDGQVIIDRAPAMAESLEKVCRKNKRAYHILATIAKGTDWTAIFMAYGGVSIAIAANHNAVPHVWTQAFGIQPPPERETASQYPAPERYSEGVVNSGPSEQTTEQQTEAPGPGLHVSAHQLELLQEQAIREALELQRRAQVNGAEGMPAPETNPAGRVGY